MLNWLFKPSPSPSKPRYAIGLMSGTSLTGWMPASSERQCMSRALRVIQSHASAFSRSIQEELTRIIQTGQASLPDLVRLEAEYTDVVIRQCLQLIQTSPGPISVIGFHGQTLWHDPEVGSTLQIGFAERLAEQTGIPVAHQFRRGDMARGGQGAPLAPLFHETHFSRETENVAVLNLGGIANISLLIRNNHRVDGTLVQPTRLRISGIKNIDSGPLIEMANTRHLVWSIKTYWMNYSVILISHKHRQNRQDASIFLRPGSIRRSNACLHSILPTFKRP